MAIAAAANGGSVRARSRVQGNSAPVQQNPGATSDWMRAGAAAIEGYQEHQQTVATRREERQASVGVPWRFFLAKGDEADIVILDNDFGPGLFEHDLTNHDRFKRINPKNGRPFDQFVTSPCQWETDPITQETGKEPYYATFLTVGVLKPYTNSKGETVQYQRRLMPLKGEAMEMLTTIRQLQIKAGHADAPLRGLQILMKRGTGDQSLKTGLPTFIERHDEAAILETFGHPEVRGEQDGKLIKAANADCYPVDYAAAFPKPSAEAIRQRYRLQSAPAFGSGGYTTGHFNDTPDGGGGYADDDQGGTSTTGFANAPAAAFDTDLDDDVPF